jgi:hypothetical protein|nr:hypothetical protein [uncultured Acetatifactor sp.]
MKIGDSVYTPRFCTVRINAIFENEAEARAAGFCEPTYYEGDHVILGKVLDMYSMEFAAVPKGANHE